MDEKQAFKRTKRFKSVKASWAISAVLITALYVIILQLRKLESDIKGEQPSLSSFKLHSIYRHGTSDHSYMQVMEIDDQILEGGEARFSEFSSVTNDPDDSDHEMWTSSSKYATKNPLDYEFGLSFQPQVLKRMRYRDPQFVESYMNFAHENPHMASQVHLDWIDETVLVPNISDKQTVVSLALMSSDAYVRLPHTGDWRNLTGPWNHSVNSGHGWNSDGLRGHIFVNQEQDIVVIAVKGTSAQVLAGSGEDETTVNDKINDNLLFSCCCARISYLWTTVCDCYLKSYTCDETCLERELRRKDRYYKAVLNIYKEVAQKFPSSTIWVTGHSLGGSLASLLGRTYGLPVVAFEAAGELLATRRLHLPMPPGYPNYLEGVWHFGNTGDPIFMGTCNGASSSCSIGGYAMETSCHTGKECIYDVVKEKGWHVNLLNHRIHKVIDEVLEKYDEPARCIPPGPCHDCFNWKYVREVRSSSSPPTMTTTSSTITTITSEPTITSSCVGRNWYGWCTQY
ncbi:LANO_0A01640g1_1 [Lachancea nothofagi CBS 11611]|uniref:Putative lipase ATG15 n=1 Tax=Lachancea nothofagi CBS 11611 TaxID=1266666 RepID=A0A1G4IMP9_9SACH|nr:LANO_0A01640g1_1 [Lachancea nothofagi CBS 11611]